MRCEGDQLIDAFQGEFLLHPPPVSVNRIWAYMQLFSDFAGALPLTEELKHRQFTPTQMGNRIGIGFSPFDQRPETAVWLSSLR